MSDYYEKAANAFASAVCRLKAAQQELEDAEAEWESALEVFEAAHKDAAKALSSWQLPRSLVRQR